MTMQASPAAISEGDVLGEGECKWPQPRGYVNDEFANRMMRPGLNYLLRCEFLPVSLVLGGKHRGDKYRYLPRNRTLSPRKQ